MRLHFIKPVWPAFMALVAGGCCTTPDFNVGDMDGRLDFSGSLAFEFEFDADMEFDFDGDFSGWAGLGAATSLSLDIDIEGKIAYEQEFDLDIDDDGVEEEVRVIGFGDGDPNELDTVVATWQGDVYTFDDGYCYVLVWSDDSVTLLTGPCEEDGPVLACTSPADELDDVSCEVCDEAGRCTECDGTTVGECISDGAEELDDLPEPEPTETEETDIATETETGTTVDAAMPEPGASDAGAPTVTDEADASPEPTTTEEPEPEPTDSEAYRTCLDQLSVIEGSLSLCGLSLTLETSELCSGHLGAVNACFSSVDGLDIFSSPCSALESDDCSEVVQ
jgi:hypothetical protein